MQVAWQSRREHQHLLVKHLISYVGCQLVVLQVSPPWPHDEVRMEVINDHITCTSGGE